MENIGDKRKDNREKMRRWRSNPDNLVKLKKRRKELRETNKELVKKKEQEYYKKNREHILQRCRNYQKANPQVKKKAQEKSKALGSGILKGKRERKELRKSYIVSQIRKEKTNKSIEQKQAEILIYRLKKQLKKI